MARFYLMRWHVTRSSQIWSEQSTVNENEKKKKQNEKQILVVYLAFLYFWAQIVHFVCLGCKATAKYFCWNKGRLWRFYFKRMISCRVSILSSFLGLRLSLGPAMAADQLVARHRTVFDHLLLGLLVSWSSWNCQLWVSWKLLIVSMVTVADFLCNTTPVFQTFPHSVCVSI